MTGDPPSHDLGALAAKIHEAVVTGGTVERPLADPPLDLTTAYTLAGQVRRMRIAGGAVSVGRKLGFTNKALWARYGVDTLIIGDMFDNTVVFADDETVEMSLTGLAEPRLEPEIVVGLGAAPYAGMEPDALAEIIDWIAVGFEIVQSIYPGWTFDAPEAVASGSLHGRLIVGPTFDPGDDTENLAAALADTTLILKCDDSEVARGTGAQTLGGPLHSLAHALKTIDDEGDLRPMRAGECVTTGTVTDAHPVEPGQVWSLSTAGVELPGVSVRFI